MLFQNPVPPTKFFQDEVLVYLRKSRTDDPALSVEEVLQKHETILDEWSMKNIGAVVPAENKYKEIVSGETIADRPEFKKLLKQIESPKIKAILTVEVQRLSRGDLEDAGRLIKLLRYTNTIVITPTMTYDLSNEFSRDIFERELKRGNEFLEYQKKILNRGRLLSVQQGNYIASTAPYGYEKTVIEVDKRKCHTLKIKEDEAHVVRMIFDMYVTQNMGRVAIAHRLDELGIAPPKGKYWSPPALKDMLENVHYIGKVKWNWRKTLTIVENSDFIRTRPKSSEYLVYDGKHPAIISEELFQAAREKQGRNHRAKPDTKVRNPLAGLLYCQCGRAMSLRFYKDKNGNTRSAPRLLCDNQFICKTTSCTYQEVLDRVIDTLRAAIRDFELKSSDDNKTAYAAHLKLIQLLEEKYAALEQKELRQWEKYSEEQMPKEIFEKLNSAVLQEKENIMAAIEKARSEMPDPIIYEKQLHRFQDALDSLLDSNTPAEQKNALLKTCIERINYNRPKSERSKPSTASKSAHLSWNSSPIELEIKLKI